MAKGCFQVSFTGHVAALLRLKANWLFSATDEETPYDCLLPTKASEKHSPSASPTQHP